MKKLSDLIKKLFFKFARLIKYGLVGIINTLVDYGVFTLVYQLAGLEAGPSQILGFMCGSACGYVLNSNFTFREGKGRTKGQFFQYVGVDIVLALFSGWLMQLASGAGINAYLAKIVLTVVIMLLHYIIYKYIVFRIKKEES
jgi:putative flippase GtrA